MLGRSGEEPCHSVWGRIPNHRALLDQARLIMLLVLKMQSHSPPLRGGAAEWLGGTFSSGALAISLRIQVVPAPLIRRPSGYMGHQRPRLVWWRSRRGALDTATARSLSEGRGVPAGAHVERLLAAIHHAALPSTGCRWAVRPQRMSGGRTA